MATASFTKQMIFNKKETKALLAFLEKDNNVKYKVKTPAPKEASYKTLKKVFGGKNK